VASLSEPTYGPRRAKVAGTESGISVESNACTADPRSSGHRPCRGQPGERVRPKRPISSR
jgi:hypothetical protein